MLFIGVAAVAIGIAVVGLTLTLPFVTFGHALLIGLLIVGALLYLGALEG